jgi:hypothetical protein
MSAQLRVPERSAGKAGKALHEAFGPCRSGVSTALATRGLRTVCLMASENGADESGELPSRLFSVGTGLDKKGDRLIALSIRSR